MLNRWRINSPIIDNILTAIGILAAIIFASEAVHILNKNSVSAEAKIILAFETTERELVNILLPAKTQKILACSQTWQNGVFKLSVDGRAGYYPELEYNVETSKNALGLANTLHRLLFDLNEIGHPSRISVDAVISGWADFPKPKTTVPYAGKLARCVQRDAENIVRPVILQNNDKIASNRQLACARAADFKRASGLGDTFPGRAELFGIVTSKHDEKGSSRGVSFEVSITGYSQDRAPMDLSDICDDKGSASQ